jgi:uncharacterized repeat protein (TIGR01451 family)
VIASIVVAVPAAAADTATQQPLPWSSPPFTSFAQQVAATDSAGDIDTLASGPSSTWYVAGYNPQNNQPAPIGGGLGYVPITLPAGAATHGMFVQGTTVYAFGSVPQGAFIQGYSLADGSSSGPTILDKPPGTSFTAAGGGTSPAASGGTNFFLIGADSISHNPLLVTGSVSNGAVGVSTLCPSYFNTLTSGSLFAPSSIAANASGQLLLGGVQISGLSESPTAGAVNTGCAGVTLTPLMQPGGQSDDGFADTVAPLPGGGFVAGSDLSTSTGASILINPLSALGTAAPASNPFLGGTFGSVSLTNVFPFGTGFAAVGSQRPTGSPTEGFNFAWNRPTGGPPDSQTTFTDSHQADVIPQFALPISNGIAIGGLGSPTSGPNTLDIWKVATSSPPPPSCTPVTLKVTKTAEVPIQWTNPDTGHTLVFGFQPPSRVGSTEAGSVVRYEITISNTGSCVADDVQVSDDLPFGFTYDQNGSGAVLPSGVHLPGGPDLSGRTVTADVGSLQPKGTYVLSVQGRVTGLGEQRNTATVSAAGGVLLNSKSTYVTVTTPAKVTGVRTGASGVSGAATLPPPKPARDATAARADSVARIDIAIESTSRSGKCASLSTTGRLKATSAGCQTIVWLKARGTTHWSYRFRHRLPHGTYVLLVRTMTRAGVTKSTFARSLHDLFRFTVR